MVADSQLLDGPQISYPIYTSMYDNTTGTTTKQSFVFSQNHYESGSSELLGESLLKLGHENKLPAIVVVNVGQPLFGQVRSGWHVINVYDYDPATRLVRYSNQWDEASDRMEKGVPIEDLFQAMKSLAKPELTDDSSGPLETMPTIPPPRWLKLSPDHD